MNRFCVRSSVSLNSNHRRLKQLTTLAFLQRTSLKAQASISSLSTRRFDSFYRSTYFIFVRYGTFFTSSITQSDNLSGKTNNLTAHPSQIATNNIKLSRKGFHLHSKTNFIPTILFIKAYSFPTADTHIIFKLLSISKH